MQQITTGSTDKVELTIIKNGSQVNADGAVTLHVYDADDTKNTVLLTGTATNEQPDGIYSFQLDNTITGTTRILRVNWAYSVGGVSTSSETFIEVSTPYTTVSDLVDFLGIGTKPEEPNYKSPELLSNYERLVRKIIDAYTSQSFSQHTGIQEVTGDGSDALFMTEKVLRIDQVYENDVLVLDNTTGYNNFGFSVEITQTGKAIRIVNPGWDVRYDNQVDPTILFYGRFRNNARYQVNGLFGWSYVPQDIKMCANMLVSDLLANDASWRIKYLENLTMSEISLKMHPGAFNGTGNVIVDSILDQYRNIGILVI